MANGELTPTQRRYLKRLAHPLKALLQMGKDGPSPGFITQLEEQIGIHELIKLRVLNNCELTRQEIEAPIKAAGINIVQRVGHVYTVFRQRVDDSQLSLPER